MLWRATEISQPPKSLRPPSMAEDEQDGAWAHEIPPTLLPRSLRDHVDRIRSCTEKNTGAYEHGETHQGKCCHSSAGSESSYSMYVSWQDPSRMIIVVRDLAT
ncbi:uncharacterized protein LOC124661134 isoform X2 [Lolium rigidum]|uniref:uncharacterized protein LOC124661134 isoform X2 n=1 Tax=Lolium rigidum TaxID=89674 RepID=UPI001F5E3150|nr:uncharacterized protein LOC124661134 isoform X2 [Lolium rigidum]